MSNEQHLADNLPLYSASIAITLAKNMTANELNFWGNFFTAVASEMLAIAAARASMEDQNS